MITNSKKQVSQEQEYHAIRLCYLRSTCSYSYSCFRNYTAWNWTSFWHYKYGNCFVFNGGQVNGVPVEILRSNNRGPSEGVY